MEKNKSNIIGNNIGLIMDELRIKRKDLISKLTFSHSRFYDIQKAEDLNKFSHFELSQIANLLQCSVDDLKNPHFSIEDFLSRRYSDNKNYNINTQDGQNNYNVLQLQDLNNNYKNTTDSLECIKLYEKLNCQKNIAIINDNDKFAIFITNTILQEVFNKKTNKDNSIQVVRVKGNAMYPVLSDGDYVFVDVLDISIETDKNKLMLLELLHEQSEVEYIIRSIKSELDGKITISALAKNVKSITVDRATFNKEWQSKIRGSVKQKIGSVTEMTEYMFLQNSSN